MNQRRAMNESGDSLGEKLLRAREVFVRAKHLPISYAFVAEGIPLKWVSDTFGARMFVEEDHGKRVLYVERRALIQLEAEGKLRRACSFCRGSGRFRLFVGKRSLSSICPTCAGKGYCT